MHERTARTLIAPIALANAAPAATREPAPFRSLVPVQAAAAFTLLYRAWCSDARGLAATSEAQARSLAGLYVADVLSLWDERAESWLDGSPTILRLEECDVAVFAMRDACVAPYFGCVETDEPVANLAPRGDVRPPHGNDEHRFIFWKSLRPCSFAIGRQLDALELETDEDGRITALAASLDDGGALRITCSGVDCVSETIAAPLARAV